MTAVALLKGDAMFYEEEGYCPVCESEVTFYAEQEPLRDYLLCRECHSMVRERALALVLDRLVPDWRNRKIHESSSAGRGISAKMAREAQNYVSSQFFPNSTMGAIIDGHRNENLECQSFEDKVFDLVITLDVMEHVFHPQKAYLEIYRTLQPGGYYIHTFPIYKQYTEGQIKLAQLNSDGSIHHISSRPEYHGNPVDPNGSLVTFYYGYDVSKSIAEWAPFDVEILRFWDRRHAIMGDFTEVIVCRKSI